MATWTIMGIILVGIILPNPVHKTAAPWFVWGVAFGMLIHKGTRWWFDKRRKTQRLLRNIVDAWPVGDEATALECKALDLLAKGPYFPLMKYKSLHKYIEYWRNKGQFTKKLALINACVYRVEGDHTRSIAEVNAIVPTEEITEPIDRYLLLLKAINLAEIDEYQYTEAGKVLMKVLSSKIGLPCPLAHATKALRLAEKTLREPDSWNVSEEPLNTALTALNIRNDLLRRRKETSAKGVWDIEIFLGRLHDFSVPVTSTFMSDVIGYSFLAGGLPYEARVIFESCIEHDPSYSSAYLHLGDYFLYRNWDPKLRRQAGKKDLWHALVCYYTASYMESNIGGKLMRQADIRIDLVKNLQ